MPLEPTRVFVYGTLQTGGVNAGVAERAGLVRAVPAVVRDYQIYDLRPEGYPAVVAGPGRVHGEVLILTGSLDEMDALEGVHARPPLYRRARCTPEGQPEAWIYVYARLERLRRPGAMRLPFGRWPAAAGPLDS